MDVDARVIELSGGSGDPLGYSESLSFLVLGSVATEVKLVACCGW